MAANSAPRAIWTGAITFGLVNIPVRLYPAVREQTVHFHMLHDQDHARLRRKLVCSADGKEVHPEHMVKGFEVAPDQYVVVKQEELEAVQPKKSRMIQIEDFVDMGQIDPVFFDRAYYVAPQEGGARAYRLLVEAMRKARKVGIARFVMHSKEYLAALRPVEMTLCLETMHFADEVLPVQSVESLVGTSTPSIDDRELKMAHQLIDSLSGRFNPDKYEDEYRKALMEMVERKAAGEQVVTAPQPAEAPARVTNLMEALQASLQKAKAAAKAEGRGEPAKPDRRAEVKEEPRPARNEQKGESNPSPRKRRRNS